MEHWLFPNDLVEARRAQKEMARKVIREDAFSNPIVHIAGMDISNTPFDPEQWVFGAAVSVLYPTLDIVETATQVDRQQFPYIPGFLGFREVPTLVKAYRQLSFPVELVMVDGHGMSHPEGVGVATHLGVVLDIPSIGVAKSILVGKPAGVLAEPVGSHVPLIWKDQEIGMIVRTKKRCCPLIISAGHRITLLTAFHIVMHCLQNYRLPEPTRQAHLAANLCRKGFQKNNIHSL